MLDGFRRARSLSSEADRDLHISNFYLYTINGRVSASCELYRTLILFTLLLLHGEVRNSNFLQQPGYQGLCFPGSSR